MRFSSKYDELIANLNDLASVVEDSLSSDSVKNIVFKLTKGNETEPSRVCMIGINQFITFKRFMHEDSVQVTLEDGECDSNGVMLFQLNCKELRSYLDSYKSLRRTYVEEVIFEPSHGKIKCTVIEKNSYTQEQITEMQNAGQDELLDHEIHSYWHFSNIPIDRSVMNAIGYTAPETELTQLQSVNITMYTATLLPIMQNGTNLYSYMMFDDEHVIAFAQAYTVVMNNQITEGGIFTGLRLQYRAIAFLNKVICNDEVIQVAKTDRHIYIKTDLSEAFILYDTTMPAYQAQLDLFKKDHVVTVDRLYLKDVLKRLSLENDSIEVGIKAGENKISLSNSKFGQDIDIVYKRGFDEFESIKFRVMPEVLNKAIIGDDSKFTYDTMQDPDSGEEINVPHGHEVFLYYCHNERNKAVVFSDVSSMWFSIVRVKTS